MTTPASKRFVLALSAIACALVLVAPLCAQPLNGTYTCAAGNPGGAFDFGDIGAFFDALKARDIDGPVTLEVYDDGGPFYSNSTYRLVTWTNELAGLSPTRPITICAAQGEAPVIQGHPNQAALQFQNIGPLNIDGLTICNGLFGIMWDARPLGTQRWSAPSRAHNIRISSCRIFNIQREAISYDGDIHTAARRSNFVTFENNMIWDCAAGLPNSSQQVISLRSPGIEWVFRHNTIVHHWNGGGATGFILWVTTSWPTYVPDIQIIGNVLWSYSNGTGPNEHGEVYMFDLPPTEIDYNIYCLSGTAQFGRTTLGWHTFAQWQSFGLDLNSVIMDPMLVSTTPTAADLHLQSNSPARNFVPIPTVDRDIDGEARPFGGARDAGADEYNPSFLSLEYNALPVPHAGLVDVGAIPQNGAGRLFRVLNNSTGILRLGAPPVSITPGANRGPGTALQTLPTQTVAPGLESDFTVFIQPLTVGPLALDVTIYSNDALQAQYTFTITATVIPPNEPARATLPPGSAFTGPPGGPFVVQLDPGQALASAALELTDTEADAITVTVLAPVGAAPAGITAPAIPAPGHPLVLAWGGVADAANTPQAYTWRVIFSDAVNGSPVQCLVTVVINNLAPVHVISGAFSGDGSAATPYSTSFARGDGGGGGKNLCSVDDPNAGQSVSLGAVTAGANPGASGFAFVFTLTAGQLSVAPNQLVTQQEVGLHSYSVEISDGLMATVAHVAIHVTATALQFANPTNLPGGTPGEAYTVTLHVVNAIGALTFTLTGGALPDGLTLNADSGEISGVPTQTGSAQFTVQSVDSTLASVSETFTLPITLPPAPPPATPPGTASSGGGCVAGTAAWPWMFALLAFRRRRCGMALELANR